MTVRQFSPIDTKERLRNYIRDARNALRSESAPSDESIHEARKNIKRARAHLRLLRGNIDRTTYQRENGALRDSARPLSEVRDASVMRETLDGLVAKEKSARAAVSRMRLALVEKHRRARGALRDGKLRMKVLQALEKSEGRVTRWRFTDDQSAELHAEIQRMYRKGRETLRQAEASGSAQDRHEARKHAKYLELALEPVARRKSPVSKVVNRAETLEEHLGLDHDLEVLREQIRPALQRKREPDTAIMLRIEKECAASQDKAMKAGRKLYKMKARKFRKRLQKDLH